MKSQLIRLYNSLRGRPDMPVTVNIETASTCDQACPYCPVRRERRPAVLNTGVYQVLDELSDARFMGNIVWAFYNEPFLDRRLISYAIYCAKNVRLAKQQIFTNGQHLPENFGLFLEYAQVTISRHPALPVSPWMNICEKLTPAQQRRVAVALPTETTVASRAGAVGSTTELMTHCRPNTAVVTADGYLGICCHNYRYARTALTRVAKIGLLPAWENSRGLRDKIARWGEDRPDYCKKCTVSHLQVVSYQNFVAGELDEFKRRYDK